MTFSQLNQNYANLFVDLEKTIIEQHTQIESWFRGKWREHQPPFYGSVDLRNSGYKLASIDMNLFPGGFNNLNDQFTPLAAVAAQTVMETTCSGAKSILIIPENHTRNTFYLENVFVLQHILRSAGYTVRVGSLNPEVSEATEFTTAMGNPLLLEPVKREGDQLVLADGFKACLILLNNDLSGGVPEILQGITQHLLPPTKAGWQTRRKTHHFGAYNQVAAEFAQLIGIDEWQINPYFEACGNLNFQSREGEDQLAEVVERLLAKIQAKYDEKGITDEPFVIVKADAGTYGMGIMSVKSADDVRGLNRKNRNKMAVIKEGLEVNEVIVQEGIYTNETVHGAVAEPVVYMMDRFVIGGFYRVHEGRGTDENLNASGMRFIPLDKGMPMPKDEEVESQREFAQWDTVGMPDCQQSNDCENNRLYVYGVMARLSLLAASLELEAQ